MSQTAERQQMTIRCTLNGEEREFRVHPLMSALDFLRYVAVLPGTKEGCKEGECGACAILVDGTVVNSCLVPALHLRGKRIVTVEGLAGTSSFPRRREPREPESGATVDGVAENSSFPRRRESREPESGATAEGSQERDPLSALQEAFLECGGAQCGICTPGMLTTGTALLERGGPLSEADVREFMAGNLCRCTGYGKIVEALLKASAQAAALSNPFGPSSSRPTTGSETASPDREDPR